MTKQELHDLAAIGFVTKLKRIEADLADGFKLFPEAFLGTTAPQLVRPELRNGHAATGWPIVAGAKTHAAPAPALHRSGGPRVLAYLTEHGQSRAKDVASALSLSKGTVGSALDRLRQAGAIERIGIGLYAVAGATGKKRAKKKRTPVRERRTGTARLLDALAAASQPMSAADLATAAGVPARGIGALSRRGYVRKTKRGYVRTAKPFDVEASR